jgi:hypothetical protein
MSSADADEETAFGAPISEAAERLAAGDACAALGILSPLIESGDPSLAARFLLAMTAWTMGRLDWALALARECHERAPMDGTVAETLASLYAQCGNLVDCVYLGKLGTALGGHGRLASLVPAGFPSFELAFATIKERPRLARARLDLAAGRLEDALENARQHVALEEGSVEGSAFLAATLLRAGRACDAAARMREIEGAARSSAPLASLFAQSLTASGELAAARQWHETALTLARDDASIAAARIADGPFLDDQRALTRRAADWARRFCPPPKPRAARVPERKLVIAYLVTAFGDRGDAAVVAEVARAHDRERCAVIGYGRGAQSWPENAAMSGAFDRWQDVASLDAATMARYFSHDGVDVAIDASGFAAPENLLALARSSGVLRVSWLGNPAGLLAPIFDARIAAAPDRASDESWLIGGAYPVPRPLHGLDRVNRPAPQFGADLALAQLDDETVAVWRDILAARPDAKLLLRVGDNGRATVDRLVARLGLSLAARVDLVAAARFEEFYALVDVALAPRRGYSPRLAAEASSCGIPTVSFVGSDAIEPYGAFLRGLGHRAPAADYVECALALAAAPTPSVAAPDALSFARAIEDRAARAFHAGAAA